MAVIINIENANGAVNIDNSRQATNRSNLEEGRRCWRAIATIDEERFPNYEDVIFTREKRQANSSDEKEYYDYLRKQIRETIPSRIEKNYIHYGLDDPSEISWTEIKRMATYYLEAEEWLQINFCIDSTRQGVDEKVQRAMLNHYVPTGNFEKEAKEVYVYEGDLYYSKRDLIAACGSDNIDRKDIDTAGEISGRRLKIFQKYTKVGGGHQDNVFQEALHFVRDCEGYTQEHDDNFHFIAQLDGEWVEQQIPHLRVETESDRVFIGNTEQVIAWLNNLPQEE